MKYAAHLLTFATLLAAGQAVHAQAPVAMGADVPELMKLIEKRKKDGIRIEDPITPIDMQNKKLQGAQLTNANLSSANFTGSDLSNANFSGATLMFTNFHQANLTNASFVGTDLSSAIFDHATLVNANFTNTTANSKMGNPVDFHEANLTNANFTNANLPGAVFSDANLTKTNFTGATGGYFELAKFAGTNFSNANLTGSMFLNCTGFNSTILNSKTVFSYALGLTDEQLAYARSKGASGVPGKDWLRLQELLGKRTWVENEPIINMPNADLQYTSFRAFDLQSINLSGANLIGADLQYRNFNNTNLSGANLTKANLTGADLTKANLTQCIGFNTTIINNETNFKDAIGLTPEQKAYARSKGAQNVPN